jgi:hypothetical protein
MSNVGITTSLENLIVIFPLLSIFPKVTLAGGNSFTVLFFVKLTLGPEYVLITVALLIGSFFAEKEISIMIGGIVLGNWGLTELE